MPEAYRIILEGSGGQGIGLGGKILAEAAVASGLNASQNQSYGAQARGGFSSSHVIINPGEIIFPLVDEPNIVVALTPAAYLRHKDIAGKGGLLLYDTGAAHRAQQEQPAFSGDVKELQPGQYNNSGPPTGCWGFPYAREAIRLENYKGITLLAIGTLVGLTKLVDKEHLEEAINDNFTPSVAQVNLACFRRGLQLAEEAERTSQS